MTVDPHGKYTLLVLRLWWVSEYGDVSRAGLPQVARRD